MGVNTYFKKNEVVGVDNALYLRLVFSLNIFIYLLSSFFMLPTLLSETST